MIPLNTWLAFVALALVMALTPGPNMAYLMSRSVCQGRKAGMISLAGVGTAFAVYVALTSLGITALLFAVPMAYDTLRLAGAAYLTWLAWQALRPGGVSLLQPRALGTIAPRRLFVMGFLTCLLNPKVAILYLALFPQFIDPTRGSVLLQSVQLGLTQIAVGVSINGVVVFAAGSLAIFLSSRPLWLRTQRWLMGSVFGGLAVRMALESRR